MIKTNFENRGKSKSFAVNSGKRTKKKLKYFINFKSHKDFFQQKNKPLKS